MIAKPINRTKYGIKEIIAIRDFHMFRLKAEDARMYGTRCAPSEMRYGYSTSLCNSGSIGRYTQNTGWSKDEKEKTY